MVNISSLKRVAIVVAGIVLSQFILYGPSLLGRKVLLPLDILAAGNIYIPRTPGAPEPVLHNHILSDLVFQWEPARQFAISELRAGRLPMWNPYQYAGAPVIWPKFSPFLLLECCTRSPIILAWVQLLQATLAGLGMYLFCRRILSISFWAATIPAWCYPLTGFFVFWQGYPTCYPVFWLPWLLLAVDKTIRRPSPRRLAALSITTALVLVSGALDVADQVLLVSGLYAVWRMIDGWNFRHWPREHLRRAIAMLLIGWVLGFMLAAPYVLPLVEYARTGLRMEERGAGNEERPPVGLSALPQTILPDLYGTDQAGSYRTTGRNQNESSAAAYAGLFATLLVAPLAFWSRRNLSINVFWGIVILFALSWCLDIPGIVAVLRLPGLNMMSHNRLVFAASFAILAMAAVGLDVLERQKVPKRWWFCIPAILLILLCNWFILQSVSPPVAFSTGLESSILQGGQFGIVHTPEAVRQAKEWFAHYFASVAVLAGLCSAGWWMLYGPRTWQRWAVPVLGVLMVGDLLSFAWGRATQSDPALYYPAIPALDQIAQAAPGRVTGFECLPAALAQTRGLRDIRGYDAVDPKPLMEIMQFAALEGMPVSSYAFTQWFSPQGKVMPPDGIKLSPILDMLGVRYVIFRSRIPVPKAMRPAIESPDYWVLLNHAALPRPFIPDHVEVVPGEDERLNKIASPQFNPLVVAYVESPVNLPGPCRGAAAITTETPTRIVISAQMETAGLIVLADLWDAGWKAYLNGSETPILRTNNAVRGVVVPPGNSTLEFRYQPASFLLGACLTGLAAVVLIGVSIRGKLPL